jgi:hypothetical protein
LSYKRIDFAVTKQLSNIPIKKATPLYPASQVISQVNCAAMIERHSPLTEMPVNSSLVFAKGSDSCREIVLRSRRTSKEPIPAKENNIQRSAVTEALLDNPSARAHADDTICTICMRGKMDRG